MKTKIITITIMLFLTLTSLHAQNGTVGDAWEASPQYKEYLKFMEAGDLKSAMKIKKETTEAITLRVMTPYLSHYKEEYRKKYEKRLYDLPFGLLEILNTSFFQAQDILKLSNVKEKNLLATQFYEVIYHTFKEDAKAVKYAKRITKSFSKLENTQLMNILETMAKESDIEANKTPEQKQKEYDAYMAEKQKQLEKNKKQLEKNQHEIDKWNEIIARLKGLE